MTPEPAPTEEQEQAAIAFCQRSRINGGYIHAVAALLARREAAARLEGRIEQAREDEERAVANEVCWKCQGVLLPPERPPYCEDSCEDWENEPTFEHTSELIAARRRELELQRQPPTAKETK